MDDLLVVAEQGIGDTLQFVRYVPFARRWAGRVSLCVPDKLRELVQLADLADRLLSPQDASGWDGAWLPLLSLPGPLGVTASEPLLNQPYLSVPSQRVEHWRQRLTANGGELLVALHWQGKPSNESTNNRGRSLPLAALAPLAAVDGVGLVSLQKGPGSEQLAACGFRDRFVSCRREVDGALDFVETAAIVRACDLVITTDSMVAHLAGGLGVPTWLLLKHVPDWRWGLEGESTGWYGSMRLFRQRQRGDWGDVVERVRRALMERLTERLKERATLERAGRCMQEGRLEEAEAIYRQRISAGRQEAVAYGNLAAICGMTGRCAEAVEMLRRALEIRPDYPEALSNLGIGLMELGDLNGAVEALLNLARLCRERKDHQGTIQALRRALAIRPEMPQALNNLGCAQVAVGAIQEAIATYRRALHACPRYPLALANLAHALTAQGDLPGSLAACRQAMAIQPDHPDAVFGLGCVLEAKGDLSGAAEAFRKALGSRPTWVQAQLNLASVLRRAGDLTRAVEVYRSARLLRPHDPELLGNLGICLRELGDPEAAIRVFEQALALRPDHPEAHLGLAFSLLMLGRYEEGWRHYAWRSHTRHGNQLIARPRAPRWDGRTPVAGELVVVAEQGLGDVFQFVRYLPRLRRRVPRVSVCVMDRLVELVAGCGLADRVYPSGGLEGRDDIRWLPLLSLPGLLGVTPEQVPEPEPYLRVAAERVEAWRRRLRRGPELLVALNWQGNPTTEQRGLGGRSFPLEALAPLARLEGVRFVSLQKGPGADQLGDCSFRERFVAAQAEVEAAWGFVDAAAIMKASDLVISCDTASAHLAGGLGVPVWTLLKKVPEWRWGMAGESTHWYPGMRLFRQRREGDWAEVVERVRQALAERLAEQEMEQAALERAGQLMAEGRLNEAEAIYLERIGAGTGAAVAYGNLAAICGMDGRFAEAVELLHRALAIQPDYPEALSNLGNGLMELGDAAGAVEAHRRCLALRPDFPEGLTNLCSALRRQGDLDGALTAYRRALELHPDSVAALVGLGVVLREQGDLAGSLDAFGRALAIEPDHPDARLGRAFGLLLQDRYLEGWRDYEWRWRARAGNECKLVATPSLPRWDGRAGELEELVVVAEQGLGDVLQFVRYVPLLGGAAGRLSLCVQAKLVGLVRGSGLAERVLAPAELAAERRGAWIPLLSLPGLLGVTPENPRAVEPYIRVPADRVAHWRSRLGVGRGELVVALNWQGNPAFEARGMPGRSLPLETLAPLAQVPGVRFVALQKGPGSEQLAACSFRERFVACQAELDEVWDFVETAAIVRACDLVITTDSMVAHLAGGLGVPTWLMLMKVPDWRWGLEGESTGWYRSMRLFRQQSRGDWGEVVERVRGALAERLAGAPAAGPPSTPEPTIPGQTDPAAELARGNALLDGGELEAAIAAYRRVLAHRPDHADAHNNLGAALNQLGQPEAGVAACARAIELRPDFVEAHWNRALGLLLLGRYPEGWREYEWRWHPSPANPRRPLVTPPSSRWDGRGCVSGELLLVAEQGLGDTLMFARYTRRMAAFAERVCLCVPDKLVDLLRRAGVADAVQGPREALAGGSAAWFPLLSLPGLLGVSAADALVPGPYLRAPVERTGHWRRRLHRGGGFVVGLNWQGNPNVEKGGHRGRSLPLEALAPLAELQCVRFVALQKGPGAEQLAACSFRQRFVACQEEIDAVWDFEETAAIVRACDLVISSDTALAHLAGGLAAPTWLLLQRVPEWRWGLAGESTGWYPSMRLFRQQRRGDWGEVVERVRDALVERLPATAAAAAPGQAARRRPAAAAGGPAADLERAGALMQRGQLEEAESIYRAAIAAGSERAVAFANLAAICGMTGRVEAAEALLEQALALDPGSAEAWTNLGVALRRRGDPEGAIEAYERALALRPDLPETLRNLGVALRHQRHHRRAVEVLRRALTLRPDCPDTLAQLGQALLDDEQPVEAATVLRRARELCPDGLEVLLALAIALRRSEELEESLAVCLRALELRPDSAEALSSLAITLRELGRLEESIETYGQALALRPDYPEALSNLGNALLEQGSMDEALAAYRRSLELRPDYADARFNISLALLARGDYAQGWEAYEWRWKREGRQNPIAQPRMPLWQAGAEGREPVLLVAEQGLGDVLQFVRYALLLRERVAWVGLCVPAKLAGLLEGSGLAARVLGAAEGEAWREGPWLPLLSLPRQLGVTAERPLLDGPYLRVPAERVAWWRERLGAGRGELLVGVHWQGNPRTEKQGLRGRSFALAALAPLAELEGVRLVSLQKGEGSEQLGACGFRERFVDCQAEVEEAWDFVETGAIASACDLVITSDSALAHLCGGLGLATWLLLHEVPDWRWGLEGERTGWYRSMRLFRQRQRGNWAEVVERVREALAERLAVAEEKTEQAALERAGRLMGEGRLNEAEAIYRERIGAGTGAAVAYGNLAAICGMDGRFTEAVELLRRALALRPDYPEALANTEALAAALGTQGEVEAAVELLAHLAAARRLAGDLPAAIEAWRRALALRPATPELLSDLGAALLEQGETEAALDALNRALALRPEFPQALSNLGNALRASGDLAGATDAYQRALALDPANAIALSNLGNALREGGDPGAAIGLFERALELRPDFVDAHYNLSLALLQLGRWREGWEAYEWRWKREGRQNPIAQPRMPLWQAGAEGREPVLLVAEQGLGDVLQFVRYALLLRERVAWVGLCVPAKLAGLLEGSGLAARVLGAAEGEAWREGPWLPLLSLPRQLGVTAERPLLDGPYLRVPAERVAWWRERLGAGRGELLVGVHWQGNPRTEKQGLRGRSFALAALAPLAELEGVRLVSLQKGEGSEQLGACGFRERFVDCQAEVEEAWDFVETGAIASACDLVITSDSALAHLCGGLGLATWLLLHEVPDWRWGLEGERTGWYRSMRLFRQRQRGNWAEVVERVREALGRLEAKDPGEPATSSHQIDSPP